MMTDEFDPTAEAVIETAQDEPSRSWLPLAMGVGALAAILLTLLTVL